MTEYHYFKSSTQGVEFISGSVQQSKSDWESVDGDVFYKDENITAEKRYCTNWGGGQRRGFIIKLADGKYIIARETGSGIRYGWDETGKNEWIGLPDNLVAPGRSIFDAMGEDWESFNGENFDSLFNLL